MLGLSVHKEFDREHILLNGNKMECFGCHKKITTRNVGNVMHEDPLLFICDNPCCFASYVTKKQYGDVSE
jgi:hypothetical protein